MQHSPKVDSVSRVHITGITLAQSHHPPKIIKVDRRNKTYLSVLIAPLYLIQNVFGGCRRRCTSCARFCVTGCARYFELRQNRECKMNRAMCVTGCDKILHLRVQMDFGVGIIQMLFKKKNLREVRAVPRYVMRIIKAGGEISSFESTAKNLAEGGQR
jgi:hypothetical protein